MAQTTKAPGSPTPAAPSATVGGSSAVDAALTSQDGPDALSLSAASITPGASLAWTVYGPDNNDETAQLITAGSTSATPTWAAFTAASGRVAGLWLIKLMVTLDGLSTTYIRRVRVGDADGRVRTHAVDWTSAGVAGTKTNNSTEAVDGITISYNVDAGGSPTYVAGATGLVATPAGSPAMSLQWSATDLGAVTMNTKDDVVWYVALDASIGTGGSDYSTLNFLDSTGNDRVVAQIGYNAGSYFVRATRRLAGVTTQYEKAVASQVRQIALRFSDGVLAEVRYSLSAFNGTFPAFSSMTPVYTTNTSNCFTAYDPVAATDTAPKPAQSGSILRLTTQGSARTYARTEIRRRQAPGT